MTVTTIMASMNTAGLDHREVELADRADDQPADAGHGEDGLGDDGAAEEEAELEAGDRHERQGRVRQGVVADHPPLGHALARAVRT